MKRGQHKPAVLFRISVLFLQPLAQVNAFCISTLICDVSLTVIWPTIDCFFGVARVHGRLPWKSPVDTLCNVSSMPTGKTPPTPTMRSAFCSLPDILLLTSSIDGRGLSSLASVADGVFCPPYSGARPQWRGLRMNPSGLRTWRSPLPRQERYASRSSPTPW